ncbi:hypothetical protein TVAG_103440 [Trichomonas vaginalis G3]|uniref:Cation efflux family protein n=1 Tax=Trichomonas vaginalis (strain ATCC PRA-98 / G3) TaxID=412133 RepID=A2EKQ5_TRIV3|nr:hypothetical protein TVAGG3_0931170 [Trichomonas vaginalis G3]EAY06794.1 hypothetical protein TVAG_103440 [Trichomonas vaginalis G3]KAI5485846.1 hypothetical protein TVAGG3_0931170 [Trichomonas vaginalis G3]|eukprot:XP_001319017.1 hypothetical protein [Trichomonas vaginalis G3]
MIFHMLIVAFFAIYPKNSSSNKSVANAINFNAYQEQTTTINMSVIAEDIVSLLCSFIFLFSKNRTLDKILALVIIGVTIKLTLDSLKETISILICATPNKIRPEMPEFCNEIKSIGFVANIPVISAWQNDEFLLVGSAKIDVQKDSVTNTQQFLLFIISKFQKLGILDVTAEIKGVDVDTPKYGKDVIPPIAFNTNSIPL